MMTQEWMPVPGHGPTLRRDYLGGNRASQEPDGHRVWRGPDGASFTRIVWGSNVTYLFNNAECRARGLV